MFAPETLNASRSSSICQQQCQRHLTDGLAIQLPQSLSIIVTGIDFPMFALYITKAAGLLLSYVCTSSPNHFFLLLIIYIVKKEH